ncbi:site-specific DNA-methyltransferase [Mycoplasma phocoeninasale]|uniref:Site-specific DNA-methyltransferase n=1 Tax=Mycoplasma phocoeninasale TaxID=2726117 RepID=A0A858U1H3_9MOLU|nr:site-specific DNA-methyltransferase [Mycoplasma phocoeninasale]QJG66290.1 site-specific DNA-methyltransferase [Mycoplasma phocoeninasale]
MKKLIAEYLAKIDSIDSFDFNKDQKQMCKEILQNVKDEKDLQNVFQFLVKRVKTGFKFDIAPTTDSKSVVVLEYDEKKSFHNILKQNENENTLIIGENYDALKNLLVLERERERERAGLEYNYDVIYIDPPYNTESAKSDGNAVADDKEKVKASKFVYRDKFSRNGWLNMMNERLIMAKKLLKDDGVIFVSIDDTEQAYLKVLMDEIFREENFIANIPFISNIKGRQVNTNFALTHEYVLVYKNKTFMFNDLNEDYANSTMPNVYNKRKNDKLNDISGEFISQNLLENTNSEFNIRTRSNLFFPIYIYEVNGNLELSTIKKENFVKEIWPRKNKKGEQLVWRWSKEKIELCKNDLFIEKNGDFYNIKTKKRNFDFIFKSLIFGPTLNNKTGKDLLYDIIVSPLNKNDEFKTVKPINLLKTLMLSHPNKNARVLDFFAGSGTTGHAVLDLNREDGGSRSFTLVTNNENNIAEDVTYERLYRINNGKGSKGESFPWAEKNEPYYSSLNVFNLVKYNTAIDQIDDTNQKIKKKFLKSALYFGLNSRDISDENLLADLLALEPLEENKDATN